MFPTIFDLFNYLTLEYQIKKSSKDFAGDKATLQPCNKLNFIELVDLSTKKILIEVSKNTVKDSSSTTKLEK